MQNLGVPCHRLWFVHGPRQPKTTPGRQDDTSRNQDAPLVETEGVVVAIAIRRCAGEGLWVFDAIEV
jgi:hypothetical protein